MNIEPTSARYQFEPTALGARAIIPSRKNWFILLFLCAWLGGWVFGELSVAGALLHPQDKTPEAFLGFWIVAWTLGGAWAICILLWQFFGLEMLEVDGGMLIHRVQILGVGRNHCFQLSNVRRFRAVDFTPSVFSNQAAWMPPLFGSGIGQIAFDYGARSIRVGQSLEEAEAHQLVKALSLSMPASSRDS